LERVLVNKADARTKELYSSCIFPVGKKGAAPEMLQNVNYGTGRDCSIHCTDVKCESGAGIKLYVAHSESFAVLSGKLGGETLTYGI
jgi:hypothetical protein